MLKHFSLFAVVAILAAGCSTMQSDSGLGNAPADVAKPELVIEQISSVPASARGIEGGIPVQYRLRVANHAGHAITLKQVNLQSIGYGAYELAPASRPFQTTIEPDTYQTVDFWMPAYIENASIVGANGPVTLRVTAKFDSPRGQFQQVVVQQVNARAGVDGR